MSTPTQETSSFAEEKSSQNSSVIFVKGIWAYVYPIYLEVVFATSILLFFETEIFLSASFPGTSFIVLPPSSPKKP